MSKFLNWIIKSSANPQNTAMTVKGALIGIIPMLLMLAQMLHLKWSTEEITMLIQGITTVIASFLTIVGIIRKLVITLNKSL